MDLVRLFRTVGPIILVATLTNSPASGAFLWYSGDNNNISSQLNENNVPINTGSGYVLEKALVYQSFVIPNGQTWTITSVTSDDQMAYYKAATTATWEIRSGVSAGSSGTLVAGGDSAATQTAITPVNGYTYNDTEYRVTATISAVVLTAGTYWLAVAPDSAGYYGDQSYIETTSGLNSIGSSGATAFVSYNFPSSVSFASASSVTGISNVAFSMGVSGTFTVPEPSSVVLLGVGVVGSAALFRRRKKD